MRYEESDFPTKADYGEGDEYMIPREVDLNEHKDKYSGWTNPLSWEDDGMDDDQILNMGFDYSKLKEKEETLKYGNNDLDQDIKDTLDNEAISEDLVSKQRAKWREMEEIEAAEEAKIIAKLTPGSKKEKAAPVEKEGEEKPKASEKSDTKKAAKNAGKKEEAPKEKAEEGGEKDAAKKEESAEAKPEKKPAAKEEKKPAAKEEAAAKEGGEPPKDEKKI